MKKTFSTKKSAFSLIELSIVLIVIGLLIAGITGGASLIKSSELRSVMSEARGYAVAVNAFYSQYDALPGDFDTAVGTDADMIGNNDGQIGYAVKVSTLADDNTEGNVAWYGLDQIGAIDDDLTYLTPATGANVNMGQHVPASKIKSAGWIFGYLTDATNGSQNIVALTRAVGDVTIATTNDATASSPATVASGALTASDALSIDSKIDDGNGKTGKLRSIINDGTVAGTNCSSTAGAYAVGSDEVVCAVSYQIDVNS